MLCRTIRPVFSWVRISSTINCSLPSMYKSCTCECFSDCYLYSVVTFLMVPWYRHFKALRNPNVTTKEKGTVARRYNMLQGVLDEDHFPENGKYYCGLAHYCLVAVFYKVSNIILKAFSQIKIMWRFFPCPSSILTSTAKGCLNWRQQMILISEPRETEKQWPWNYYSTSWAR